MVKSLLLVSALLATDRPDDVRQFTVAPGEVITATLMGTGEDAVVIVPWLIGSTYSFRKVTPELVQAGRRVIVIDVLGAGSSSKPSKADYSLTAQSRRVEHVLDSLNIRNATLLTHAVSGSIAYRLAVRRPDQVRAVVAIDGGASERAGTSGLRRAMTFAPLIKLFGAKRVMSGKVKGQMSESSGDRSWITDEVLQHYTAPYREDAGHMLKVIQAIAGAEEPELIVPNLPRVEAQVVLLVGNKPLDKVLAPEKIEVLRAGLRNFRVETVDGAGVFIQEEQPAAVVKAVLSTSTGPGF
jgi:pimeloyl-ACP methyl ester carboxylesterase